MNARWQQVADKINALSARERAMLFAALAAGLLGLWNLLFLVPYEAREAVNRQAIEQVTGEIAALNAQVQSVAERMQSDPNRALRQRQSALEARLEELNQRLRERTGEFVEPAQMARLLEHLLKAQRGLRLLALESLPPQRVEVAGQTEAGELPVYRHGLQLEFSGDFISTLRYLEALEQLPWNFVWDRLEYRLEEHPRARVILRIETLSSREEWIGV